MHSIEHLYYSDFALSLSSQEGTLRSQLIAAEKKGDFTASASLRFETIASFSPEKATALWSKLKTNKTWVTPTLEGIYAAGHPSAVPAEKTSLTFIPDPLLKSWRADVTDDPAAKARVSTLAKLAENDWKLLGEMHVAGVSLLVGSDSLDEGVIPGFSLHLELAQLVKAGFTSMEAIHSATAGAAEFLGNTRDFGTIETSQLADLVLLDANPAADIANTRKIFAVVRDGQYFDRQALNSMLAKAVKAARAVRSEE
jgi:imidazolonepropionase-like amidohydrolase